MIFVGVYLYILENSGVDPNEIDFETFRYQDKEYWIPKINNSAAIDIDKEETYVVEFHKKSLSNEISLFKAYNKEKLDRYKKQLKYEIKWGIVKTE